MMKPQLTNWTIVVAGSWNVAILNPDWFAQNVLNVPELMIELTVEGLQAKLKYLHDDLIVIPQTDRVIFGCRRPDQISLAACERAAINLLNRLPVTPVTAVGINIGYEEANPPKEVASLFNLQDDQKFSAQDFVFISRSITRSIAFEDRILNFKAQHTDGGSIILFANFHKEVQNTEQAREALREKPYELANKFRDLLNNLYTLEVDAKDENANGQG